MSTPAVLAVDGGNSKTDLLLLDARGSVLAGLRTGSTSHQALGLDPAMAALRDAVARLARRAGLPGAAPVAPTGVFCLAGLDLPIDDEQVGGALRREGLTSDAVLRNDTFAVLRAGSPEGWGLAIVCGAGMNGVAVAPDGERVRFPALGAISGDGASGGQWLGLEALGAAVRATDGRGPSTLLAATVPGHFSLERPLDVTEAIYTGRLPEGRLAELAPAVIAAADVGDEPAGALLDRLADEVVVLGRAALTRLGLEHAPVPVVLGGGLFRSGAARFLDRVRDGLLAVAPGADLRFLDAPPVVGAALLGFDHLGADDATIRAVGQLGEEAIDPDRARTVPHPGSSAPDGSSAPGSWGSASTPAGASVDVDDSGRGRHD
jgi:N-acetylglucosamine kinase-like BadF-type ATPase